MSNSNIYMPILKGKEGEYRSLEVLSDHCKDSIVPMIELTPYKEDADDSAIKDHLDKLQ